MISELATNAVRHAGLVPGQDTIRMTIEADEAHVRVQVEQRTPASQAEMPGEVGHGRSLPATCDRVGTLGQPRSLTTR